MALMLLMSKQWQSFRIDFGAHSMWEWAVGGCLVVGHSENSIVFVFGMMHLRNVHRLWLESTARVSGLAHVISTRVLIEFDVPIHICNVC